MWMELLMNGTTVNDIETQIYEKVEEFQYLGVLLSIQNVWSCEIRTKINAKENSYLLELFCTT